MDDKAADGVDGGLAEDNAIAAGVTVSPLNTQVADLTRYLHARHSENASTARMRTVETLLFR